jgi:hypothetical protein
VRSISCALDKGIEKSQHLVAILLAKQAREQWFINTLCVPLKQLVVVPFSINLLFDSVNTSKENVMVELGLECVRLRQKEAENRGIALFSEQKEALYLTSVAANSETVLQASCSPENDRLKMSVRR